MTDLRHGGRSGVRASEVGSCRGRAIKEEPDRLVLREVREWWQVMRVGQRQGRHGEGDLAREAEDLAAGREDLYLRASAQERIGETGARVNKMLAVVEEEQHPLGMQMVDKRFE